MKKQQQQQQKNAHEWMKSIMNYDALCMLWYATNNAIGQVH